MVKTFLYLMFSSLIYCPFLEEFMNQSSRWIQTGITKSLFPHSQNRLHQNGFEGRSDHRSHRKISVRLVKLQREHELGRAGYKMIGRLSIISINRELSLFQSDILTICNTLMILTNSMYHINLETI